MEKLRLREVNDQKLARIKATKLELSSASSKDLCLFHLDPAKFFEAVVTTEG